MKKFELKKTYLGQAYTNGYLLIGGMVQLFKLANELSPSQWVKSAGMLLAMPAAEWTEHEGIIGATQIGIEATSIWMNPWAWLAKVGVNAVNDVWLDKAWEALDKESQADIRWQELFAVLHIAKFEAANQAHKYVVNKTTAKLPPEQQAKDSEEELAKKAKGFEKNQPQLDGNAEQAKQQLTQAQQSKKDYDAAVAKKVNEMYDQGFKAKIDGKREPDRAKVIRHFQSKDNKNGKDGVKITFKKGHGSEKASYYEKIFCNKPNYNYNTAQQNYNAAFTTATQNRSQAAHSYTKLNQSAVYSASRIVSAYTPLNRFTNRADNIPKEQQKKPEPSNNNSKNTDPDHSESNNSQSGMETLLSSKNANQNASGAREDAKPNKQALQQADNQTQENPSVNLNDNSQEENKIAGKNNKSTLENSGDSNATYPSLLAKFGCRKKDLSPATVSNALWLIAGSPRHGKQVATQVKNQFSQWAIRKKIDFNKEELEQYSSKTYSK